MRLAGLASGLDIDQMVKDLMKAERLPLDKLKQKKQTLEWQRDDYRAINTKLLSFRDKLANLKLTTNYRARTVSSSDESKVTATVTSGASQASYSISKVDQLATAAGRKNTAGISKAGEKVDPTKSLRSQENAFGTGITWENGVVESKSVRVQDPPQAIVLDGGDLKAGAAPSIKVDGKSLEIVANEGDLAPGKVFIAADGELKFGDTLKKDSVVKVDYVLDSKNQTMTVGENPITTWNIGKGAISSMELSINGTPYTMGPPDTNGIAKIGDVAVVNIATGVITFNGEQAKDTKLEVNFKQSYSSLTVGSHTSKGEVSEKIFFTFNDTLDGVIRKVNESSAGVTMFYDSFSDRMTMTRKETGNFNETGNEITFSGPFMNNVLKFDQSMETGGQNAKFTINGLETERNSNTFDMNGVTFTLKQTFQDAPVTTSVSNDSTKVFENIKEFVTQYNELIAEVGKKLNEERHRSYKPLTDEEREELSDKQIEKWEEMARSGNLKGDPMLSSVLSTMRLDMNSSVETGGLFKMLSSIGIKTTANYMEGGKLEIDEAKLKAAIEKDPDAVENIFRSPGEGDNRGIVHKLYDSVDASMKNLQEKAGRATSTNQQFALGRQLLDVGKGIDRFEDKMKMVESRYWRQFTAMEKAIQQANQQSAYLMQQFSGM